MEEDYGGVPDAGMNEAVNRNSESSEGGSEVPKDFGEVGNYEENCDDDDGGNNFRGGRGRGNFRGRGRGPPPSWMNGPPPRFRGRGYGPGGPPMRGRGYYRGRGGPRYNNGPNYDNNWGPMGPPPPGMMGGPPPFGPPPGMMGPGGPMGPPPNMMGQPPPFGGPPGMPPPNMQSGPELWVETKTDNGKSYYYHSRTRETTWTRPAESPSCKIITQGELEAMAASGQLPANMAAQVMGMNGPMGGGGGALGPAPGMMPGMMQAGQPPPGFLSQPPPWAKDGDYGNKDKTPEQENPEGRDDAPQENGAPNMHQPNGQMNMFPGQWGWGGWPPPVGQQHGQPDMGPGQQAQQMGGPAPGVGPGPVSAPGGLVAGPGGPALGPGGPSLGPGGPGVGVPGVTDPGINESPVVIPQLKEETVIPAELAARAAEWTTHFAPDGRPYYHHAANQESVWVKPKPLEELEELQAKIAIEKGEKPEKKIGVIDVEAHAEAAAAAEAERRAAAERAAAAQAAADRDKADREKAEREKAEREKVEREKAKQVRSQPISSTPIPWTPWCVVWTGDGRVFFHNPTTQQSVWEPPPQLVGNPDVDKAVSKPPAILQEMQRKEGVSTTAAAGAGAASAGAGATPAAATGGGGGNGELKRAAGSDSEDSEPEPAKKTKPEPPIKKTIEAGKEAAVEAEVRATRMRASIPLEQRLKDFRQMLADRHVSAFSTWEKELHKIVYDERYLLLPSKERRQVFDKYVRERADEERKEKKQRLQQKKNAFRDLMEEAELHSKSSYTEFSSKHGRDERFKGIEKARDRETYFAAFLAELRKREKEEKERKREQVKTDFIALLKEKNIDRRARWADAKKKIDSEARYKAVDSSSLKEDYFREYCKLVKEERKKDKEKEVKEKERERTSSKKEKKDKDRDKDKENQKDKEKDNKKDTNKKKEKGAEQVEQSTEPEALSSDSETEVDADAEDGEAEAAAARAARAQASIKEREREVQRALATSLRDRDKEREYHKRDEAQQHFNALLADLVRNPDLAWRAARKQLKKDHRYSLAKLLSKDDMERLFNQHTGALASKRRDKLRALLDELQPEPAAPWRDVLQLLTPRAPAYLSDHQMERDFREYQRDKQAAAKAAFRQLLLETRSLTHQSLAQSRQRAAAPGAELRNDPRYTALDHIPEERQQMLTSYLEELEKKGPPPPPTATEPSRRKQ